MAAATWLFRCNPLSNSPNNLLFEAVEAMVGESLARITLVLATLKGNQLFSRE